MTLAIVEFRHVRPLNCPHSIQCASALTPPHASLNSQPATTADHHAQKINARGVSHAAHAEMQVLNILPATGQRQTPEAPHSSCCPRFGTATKRQQQQQKACCVPRHARGGCDWLLIGCLFVEQQHLSISSSWRVRGDHTHFPSPPTTQVAAIVLKELLEAAKQESASFEVRCE